MPTCYEGISQHHDLPSYFMLGVPRRNRGLTGLGLGFRV